MIIAIIKIKFAMHFLYFKININNENIKKIKKNI